MKTGIIAIKAFLIVLILTILSCNSDNNDNPEPEVQEVEKDVFASVEHLGVCYSPYHNDGQAPGTAIPKSQIEADLTLISSHFDFFRTYTVADGMEEVVSIANAKGLQVALGVHCYPGDSISTKSDIDKAIAASKQFPSTVMCIVIGNETNRKNGNPNYVAPDIVAGYMDYAHSRMIDEGLLMPITACLTGAGANKNDTGPDSEYALPVLKKCQELNKVHHQIVLLNIYPYFAPNSKPGDIAPNMQWSYQNEISNAEDNFGLGVIIGEIGWPSAKNDTATSRENVANEELNFKATLSWVDGKNIYNKAYNSFWFEMFDEPWKGTSGVEAYWGLYEKNGAQSPKFTIPQLHN